MTSTSAGTRDTPKLLSELIMDIRFERDISQNISLAAWALWATAMRFDKEVHAARGVPIVSMFVVLPLVFHRESAIAIKSKMMTEGSLFRTLTEERGLNAGLQERLQSLSVTTISAINIACAAGILFCDREALTLSPARKTLPVTLNDESKLVLNAAKRVGYWLAVTDISILCNLLKIRF